MIKKDHTQIVAVVNQSINIILIRTT